MENVVISLAGGACPNVSRHESGGRGEGSCLLLYTVVHVYTVHTRLVHVQRG